MANPSKASRYYKKITGLYARLKHHVDALKKSKNRRHQDLASKVETGSEQDRAAALEKILDMATKGSRFTRRFRKSAPELFSPEDFSQNLYREYITSRLLGPVAGATGASALLMHGSDVGPEPVATGEPSEPLGMEPFDENLETKAGGHFSGRPAYVEPSDHPVFDEPLSLDNSQGSGVEDLANETRPVPQVSAPSVEKQDIGDLLSAPQVKTLEALQAGGIELSRAVDIVMGNASITQDERDAIVEGGRRRKEFDRRELEKRQDSYFNNRY